MSHRLPHIVDFKDLKKYELQNLGNNAQILESLVHLNIPIPNGFIITPSFFKDYINGIQLPETKKYKLLLHPSLKDTFEKKILENIKKTHFPEKIALEIYEKYKKMGRIFKETSVNIYTSPVKGKAIIFNNIKGDSSLLFKIKEIALSQFPNFTFIVVQKNLKSTKLGTFNTHSLQLNGVSSKYFESKDVVLKIK